ncbi:unnamed protein product [Linum tenue]|uniref:NAB domain-containing protein n=1 Tax=Linum tenue TaxID=586396 RepID=A0AAV0M3X5_9ROSI|nr:unnamed protein product [Linum tenue]
MGSAGFDLQPPLDLWMTAPFELHWRRRGKDRSSLIREENQKSTSRFSLGLAQKQRDDMAKNPLSPPFDFSVAGDTRKVMELAMESDKEIEHKIGQILKLIRNNGPDKKGKLPPPDDPKKKPELVTLVEDVHKQYQSLYSKYANLRGVTAKKARVRKKRAGSGSTSASDSEYYSPVEAPRERKATKATNMSRTGEQSDDQEHLDDSESAEQHTEEPPNLVKVQDNHDGEGGGAQVKELEGQLIASKFEMETLRKGKREMERLLAEKASEVSEVEKRNQELQARVVELESQQLEEILEKKADESRQMHEMQNHLNVIQQELDLAGHQKVELELQLDAKSKELTDNSIQMQKLRDELTAKSMVEEELRKMDYLSKKQGLELQALRNEKSKLEEDMRKQTQESTQLRESNDKMNATIHELEQVISTKEGDIGVLQNRINDMDNEASMEIANLKEQITNVQQELETSLSEKSHLEVQKERILKEREDVLKKINEEPTLKPIRHLSMESPKVKPVESTKLITQTIERKVEELAEQYQMSMENHIRLLRQRVKVAEQIHNETKDSYKQIKEELQNENKELQDKVVAFQDALRKMKGTLIEPGGSLLTGLDVLIRKLDESKHPLNKMSRISDELQIARNWMAGKKGEIKQLKDNMDDLTLQLSDKEGKVLELEARLTMAMTLASEEEKEIDALESKVRALEQELREKEEAITNFAEEKKEAIRQLCMLTDYHRNRYTQLKRSISTTSPKPTITPKASLWKDGSASIPRRLQLLFSCALAKFEILIDLIPAQFGRRRR